MLKNVAGQIAQSQMVTASDGSAFTGTVTAYVTGDGGTQAIGSVGSGICTHEGNGLHTYAPAQAETNYDNVAFTFIGTAAIPATSEYTTGVDMIAISGDVTAADNLEAQYDTTGLSGDNFPATQAQVSNLAVAGAASNTPAAEDNTVSAIKGVSFVGVETGTFTNTKPLDGVYHSIADSSNAIDIVYGFDVGGDGVPIDVTFTGYLNRNGDAIQVFGYDFIAVGWVQIGTLIGKNQATNETDIFTLFTSMVGTAGADTGKVYVRFEESAQSALFSLNTDQIFVSFASVPAGLAYQNGSVWIDTVNGVAGTVVGANGTITNPVNSIADAKTIADGINLRRFHSLPGTTFTLATSFDGYELLGENYTVALGGQSLSGTFFEGASVTGDDDGANPVTTVYRDCEMQGNALGKHSLHDCSIGGDMALVEAADYFWDECYSAVAGTGSPSVDFQAEAETKNLSNRHYSGGMEYKNFGNTGTHTSSIEGFGQVILNASCAGGTLAIRGTFDLTDNASGAVTLSEDARLTSSKIVDETWDEVLTGATHNITNSSGRRLRQIQENLGYEGGAVWIDTINGVAGTEGFENGTVDNPVDNIADANTLASSLGLAIFHVAPGSSITFAASQISQLFNGFGWTLGLGGQAIDGTTILNATVSGVGTSTTTAPQFRECLFGVTTVPPCIQNYCQYNSTITLGSDGDYFFNDGRSGVAGAGSPVIDYNSIGSSSTVNIRSWSGGLAGINIAATTVSSWEFTNGGTAQVTGTGGSVSVRGQVSRTVNNSLGSVTMDISGVMNQTTNGVIRVGVAQGPGTGNNQIQLDSGASAVDGAYDPAQIAIIQGTGAGQSRMCLEYDGATKTMTVDRNWKMTPDNTSTFLITTNPGREHVNEGLAQTGSTSTTIKLNVLASSDDDTYTNQTIFIRSGTGEDQARLITAYNGTTKIATINTAWDVTPDGTSGYVMLPTSLAAGDVFLNTQLTESYAADGVAPTLAQALMLIQQKLGDFDITGATLTVKQLDGVSTAAVYTLNNDFAPTKTDRTA